MMTTTSPNIVGVSLGMVVIDEVRIPNKPPLRDLIGGSGSWATLGQRLFATESASVGCLVVAGKDFPETAKSEFERWGLTLVVRGRENETSTRGLLIYEDDKFGQKTFSYTGGPLKPFISDLVDTPLLHAKYFHLLAKPYEVSEQVGEIWEARKRHGIQEKPVIIWEPFPASCYPHNHGHWYHPLGLVDVYSPNHLELEAMFDEQPSAVFKPEKIEAYARRLFTMGLKYVGAIIVVRAGEHGALVMRRGESAVWSPPYYAQGSPKVVDPTGAGNTFLGGYIAGLHATNSKTQAVSYGHVAASFATEQIGLPQLEQMEGMDLWNGVKVMDRLKEYQERLRDVVPS